MQNSQGTPTKAKGHPHSCRLWCSLSEITWLIPICREGRHEMGCRTDLFTVTAQGADKGGVFIC